MKTNLIGIKGNINVGKDTVGKMICQIDSSFKVKKFADKLKQFLENTFPSFWNTEMWELGGREYREAFISEIGKTRRQLIVDVGMKMRDVHEDFWVIGSFSDYNQKIYGENSRAIIGYKKSFWAFTDVRLPNEYYAIKSRGGLILEITSNEERQKNEAEGNIDHLLADALIHNDKTSFEALYAKVKDFYDTFIF